MTKRREPYTHAIKANPTNPAVQQGPYEIVDKYGGTVDRVATLPEALTAQAKYDAKEAAREF